MIANLALLAALGAQAPDAHRQFDFWIGEWSVQNRHLREDGSWVDGDVTRARITPVCGGMALCEEWAGPFRGGFMNGFSLRAYDPAEERWVILLNWTMDGNGSFGTIAGGFRHGRGEFTFDGRAPDGTPTRNRYTFSDALPDSVRWDSASSADGGRAWTTDWIMEFSRTRAADEVTRDRLFDHAWTEGDVSPHAEARALDFLVGSWEGLQSGGPRVLEARLDARTVNKGCLVVDELRTRPGRTHEGQEPWRARFAVRGWVPRGDGHFESWSVASDDTVLRRATGAVDGDGAVFDTTYRETGAVMREAWVRVSPDELHVTESRRLTADDEFRQLRVTKLKRVE